MLRGQMLIRSHLSLLIFVFGRTMLAKFLPSQQICSALCTDFLSLWCQTRSRGLVAPSMPKKFCFLSPTATGAPFVQRSKLGSVAPMHSFARSKAVNDVRLL